MPARYSRHIALTETLAAWIDAQVAKGEYVFGSGTSLGPGALGNRGACLAL